MIVLDRASRWYGQVIGINDITCQVPPGLTALLGPNGAGKSTLIKLVSGQLRPTTGTVTVDDLRPFANPKVFKTLGYCPEGESLYDDLSGRDFVSLMAGMAGLRGLKLRKGVDDAIERVGMTANAGRRIGGYSKGMRQRIKLAQAFVHDPDVLILDEPLNGLDPQGRHEISTLIRALADEGKCVLISSHILYEVEQLTHNILLLYRGRLLAQGDVYHIRGLIDKHPHRIAFQTAEPRRLGAALLELPHVLSLQLDRRDPERLELETTNPEAFYSRLPEVLRDSNVELDGFDSPDNNLESVFRYLVKD
ncbi:MAG TPA: ABC transporter ATP-binding protein [Armatimonadota bacterium]|jgi:ABC-2 type transport system ATP-binding protein